MESEIRAIILLQYLDNKQASSFASPVVSILEQKKRENDVLFSLDNFSDSLTLHYAKDLINQSKNAFIICDLSSAEGLGSLLPLLNYSIKKKHVKLISLGKNQILKSFMTALKGEIVEDVQELSAFL